MFDTISWWHDVWNLYDWWETIRARFDRKRASRSWQASKAINATAMAEDVDQPKEKPRPPAGGK